MTVFGKRTKADTGMGRLECKRDHNSTYKQWYSWLRNAKQRNLDNAEGRTTKDKGGSCGRHGNQADLVERTAFPTFDGRQKTWPESTHPFKELIKASWKWLRYQPRSQQKPAG